MQDASNLPLNFLLEASLTSLHDFELASLNRDANLWKQIKPMLEQWVEQRAAAMVARWMIEKRDELLEAGSAIEVVTEEEICEERKRA